MTRRPGSQELATEDLDIVIDYALSKGASVRMIGDDRQLASVSAGGVLRDIAQVVAVLTLTTVVRFGDTERGRAEGAASLALREGDPATAALAWTQALAMAEELFGADTVATARWRVPMAEALLAAGDLAAARDAYRRASPVLRAQMLPGSDLLQRLDRLQEALHAS